ncbi:SH2 domain-containing protein [Halteromyces radiatus]|uniref:SH2 domain-containing protein n=1 Tax=Halteromyces radiatus TaxID=101107 RepID=UPI00221F5C78|nr:SH2 domain-containing protein [Halteromyces radiatus]KAI8081499.1 SH2 domain-containing protein [Halteromyces radiatus]
MSMQDSDDEPSLYQQQRQQRLNQHHEDEENSDEEGEDLGYGLPDEEDDDDDEEEEEEEEDEEEARKVADGFIVDDEEEEQDADTKVAARRKKKRRIEDYDEELDEEDLELLEENTGIKLGRSSGPQLKRLKRGREDTERMSSKITSGVENIFSDEEEEEEQGLLSTGGNNRYGQDEEEQYNEPVYRHRDAYDDMGDFIADEDEDDLDQVLGERHFGQRDDGAATGYYDDHGHTQPGKGIMDMLPEGISEDVLVDMYDIFGDGGDYEYALYPEDQLDMENEQREPQLADIFEPSELAERMLTEEDDKIRNIDVPERLQMRYEGLSKKFVESTPEEIQQEGIWVAKQLAGLRGLEPVPEKFQTAVTYVVGFFARELLEVPHIKDHRRDFFTEVNKVTGATTEILTEDDLWEIYDLDFKYHSFMERKKTLHDFLTKYNIDDAYVRDAESKVEKMEEVNDVLDLVNLKFSEVINKVQAQNKGPKRPLSKSLYDTMNKTMVVNVLPLFGITAKEFGANYLEKNRRYYPEDSLVDPMVEGEANVDDTFTDGTKVLKAARTVLAQEMAFDPQVRKAIRRDWEEKAVVIVKPTDKGFNVIDDLHPLHRFKYLRNKPIGTFKNGDFLELLKGESDGLLILQVTIANYESWLAGITEYYLSDGYSESVEQWNLQRKEVLEQCLRDYLVPLMDKYIREKLRVESQESVCKQASKNLLAKINVGPYRGPDTDRHRNSLPRVIAVSHGNGDLKSPTMAVMLNQRGKVLDQIQVPHLKDGRYVSQLDQFIRSRKPHVVGVAGYNAETRRLIKHLQGMISEINQTRESGTGPIDLVVVDDEAARLYKNSKRARDEFPDYPEVMRYCIALARRLQNPVYEYTGLGRDLLAIRFHPSQHLVPDDVLLFYLERSLITVVNDLGVDINAAIHSPYIAASLQYVCGFGPRKAQSILKRIEAIGELDARSSLVLHKLTATNTFINCASYLRIRDIDGADILDDTRIHPQDYELARKMAGDALEIDEDEMDDYDSKVAIVTRVIKEYPEKLNDLILDDYAVVLRQQYNAPKRQILEHIKLELQGPYHDRRQRYSRPSMDETFSMVTGETRDTLREGFIVPTKVVSLRGRVANCVLDSGLEGIIYLDNVSDDRVMNVGDVLTVGQTLNCKVLRIDREKFMVELSSKASDTKPQSDLDIRRSREDEYYDKIGEKTFVDRKKQQQQKKARSNRVINHPLFRPFSHSEAEQYLETRQPGDLVIRPSSRGNSHMAITWKVAEDVYQHIDVTEEKPNAYSAPTHLTIGKLIFEDLDELIVTYVEAIAHKVDELMVHPKFQAGGSQALSDYLDSTTRANPKMSAYGFCLNEKAGYFDLGFKLNQKSNLSRWVIKVLPDGYRLRDTNYPNVDDLINGFKRLQASEARKRKGMQQKQQQQQQQQQQVHYHHQPHHPEQLAHHHHHHPQQQVYPPPHHHHQQQHPYPPYPSYPPQSHHHHHPPPPQHQQQHPQYAQRHHH